jgi:hypothetical protein
MQSCPVVDGFPHIRQIGTTPLSYTLVGRIDPIDPDQFVRVGVIGHSGG